MAYHDALFEKKRLTLFLQLARNELEININDGVDEALLLLLIEEIRKRGHNDEHRLDYVPANLIPVKVLTGHETFWCEELIAKEPSIRALMEALICATTCLCDIFTGLDPDNSHAIHGHGIEAIINDCTQALGEADHLNREGHQ